jgi:HEAT repeat protein
MRKLALVVAFSLAAGSAGFACDPADDLAQLRSALDRRAATLSKSDLAKERYVLGAFAKKHGLLDEARAEFRAAVAADPDHAAAREGLGEVRAGDRWVGHDEAMKLKGLVQRDGRWILVEEAAILDLPAKERARRAEEQEKVAKLLRTYGSSPERARRYAAEALAGVEDRYKLEPLAWGLRSSQKDVRLYCAKELGRLGERRGLRPLLWRTLHDPDSAVRSASLAAAKSIGDPNLLAPLVAGLWTPSAAIQANAVQAIVEHGEPLGVRYLVYRYEAHGGSSQRVSYTNIQQVSFIQDFDVEVAQTAFIADPSIGTIQEGFVLDAQVIATSAEGTFVEREVVHAALRKMTGATDVKDEPGAWAAWYAAHRPKGETARR